MIQKKELMQWYYYIITMNLGLKKYKCQKVIRGILHPLPKYIYINIVRSFLLYYTIYS